MVVIGVIMTMVVAVVSMLSGAHHLSFVLFSLFLLALEHFGGALHSALLGHGFSPLGLMDKGSYTMPCSSLAIDAD
ncbi:MAG TPA: hypothetical protein V6D22_09790 [Candidatus Obscuribacterales bacterium]